MPRPTTKSELLAAIDHERRQLSTLIRALGASGQQATFAFPHRDRCLRDVLGHLAGWQQLFLSWYRQGMTGQKPDMPATGHTWKTTPALNASIHAACQTQSLPQVRRRFGDRHRSIRQLVVDHTQEELFTRRRFAWTGSTSLGSYVISATSAHYRWAGQLLQRHADSLRQELE